MNELCTVFGWMLVGMSSVVAICALVWNIFLIGTVIGLMGKDARWGILRRGKAGQDGDTLFVYERAKDSFALSMVSTSSLGTLKNAYANIKGVITPATDKEDALLWAKAFRFLECDVSTIVFMEPGAEENLEKAGFPILYDCRSDHDSEFPSGTLVLRVCADGEKKIECNTTVPERIAYLAGQSEWRSLSWDAVHVLCGNNTISDRTKLPLPIIAKALSLGREELEYDLILEHHSIPIVFETPPKPYEEAVNFGKRLSDVIMIWKHCSVATGLSPCLSASDISAGKTLSIARMIGCDVALEAYYSGVPVEDIIA